MKKNVFRWFLRILGGLLAAAVLTIGGYVIYLTAQYSRIADHQTLIPENEQSAVLTAGTTYTAATYNIGFGAYNPEFSFFMDVGVMADGTRVTGRSGRAKDKETVMTDTDGSIDTLKNLQADFYLLQEIDTDSTRSWHVNQVVQARNAFPDHSATYAVNFHSAYLFYPLYEPHGQSNSGLLTLSRFLVASAERRSYPVDESFPNKFFDLDRCFVMLRLPVDNGRELVLINSHMSAYDEGGTIRAQQLALLREVMLAETAAGNYVIIGGDFNHAFYGTRNYYPSAQQPPDWVSVLEDSAIPDGFSIVRAQNIETVPTCRGADIPYQKGLTYTVTVDGFIISDNVQATAMNIDTDFQYSDHNPVLLTFSLQ